MNHICSHKMNMKNWIFQWNKRNIVYFVWKYESDDEMTISKIYAILFFLHLKLIFWCVNWPRQLYDFYESFGFLGQNIWSVFRKFHGKKLKLDQLDKLLSLANDEIFIFINVGHIDYENFQFSSIKIFQK